MLLGRREIRTHAALAKRTGLCAVYIGNILALLRLHPSSQPRKGWDGNFFGRRGIGCTAPAPLFGLAKRDFR